MRSHLLHRLTAAATLALLTGCSVFGPPPDRMTSITVAGTQASPERLIVVLPGFLADADEMQERGVAEAIHRAWPEPDVQLVDAGFNYYRTGLLEPRLHAQVIEPARAKGYREIWLAGGSMGGMGTLIYEWHHRGQMKGLVLASPFLGDEALDEIREAGGIAAWQPGDLGPKMDGDNFDRQVWSMIQEWSRQPGATERLWILCGKDDPLYKDVQLLAPLLPSDQILLAEGGHDWDFWIPTMEQMFTRIAASQRALAAGAGTP